MKIALILILAFTSSLFAASVKQQVISLNPGTWCYAVYEAGDPKAPTVLLEISTPEGNDCDDKDESRLVTKEISLQLDRGELGKRKSSYEVSALSTIKVIGADGSTNQWPLLKMKNGTVKFFDSSKRFRDDPYAEDATRLSIQLELPSELQIILEEACLNAEKVIIILKEVQDKKKGLEAVNVKLA